MNRMTSYVNQIFTSVFKFQRQKDASLQALAYPCLLSTFFDPCNNFLHSRLCIFDLPQSTTNSPQTFKSLVAY